MDTRDYRGSGTSPIDAAGEETYWRGSWRSRPYFRDDDTYDDYAPAYRTGWQAWERHGATGKSFDELEGQLQREWDIGRGSSRLGWDRARLAMRDAWERVKRSVGAGGSDSIGDDGLGSGTGIGTIGTGASGIGTDPGIGGNAFATGTTGSVTTAGGANAIGGMRSGDGFNYGYSGTSPSAGTATGTGLGGGHHRGDHPSLGYLNSFLRGEISACETYRQAIMRIGGQYPQLAECLSSHERRVASLKDRIRTLGGEPATGSGLWGAWAKLVQGTADLLGERRAIAALESGEDHGRNDYRRELDNLDRETRLWVERELLSEEERTHAMLSELKHAHV